MPPVLPLPAPPLPVPVPVPPPRAQLQPPRPPQPVLPPPPPVVLPHPALLQALIRPFPSIRVRVCVVRQPKRAYALPSPLRLLPPTRPVEVVAVWIRRLNRRRIACASQPPRQ